MIGGLKHTSSRLAIAAAASLMVGGFALTPAQAADLGGDCCADLEERVAELEATTTYHANRNVRLVLSGQVNQQLLWYDNNEESDVYVIDNDESSTRIRLTGVGTITPGWTAGFRIEFDLQMGNNFDFDVNDRDDGDLFQFRVAEWYFDSDRLGRLTVGQGSQASDGTFEVSFANTWLAGVGYGFAATNNYFTHFNQVTGTYLEGVEWASTASDFDGSRRNRVRYDSPTLRGFTLSASWGEDDFWDVALRYSNEWNGLRVAAAISYLENRDGIGCLVEPFPDAAIVNDEGDDTGAICQDQDTYGGSIAFLHTPTGIHLQGGYSVRDFGGDALVGTRRAEVDGEHWWIAAGLQRRWNHLGVSDITIDYIETTDAVLGVDNSSFGIAFTQDIDAIGGTFYVGYIHHMAEDNADLPFVLDSELDQVNMGVRIRY